MKTHINCAQRIRDALVATEGSLEKIFRTEENLEIRDALIMESRLKRPVDFSRVDPNSAANFFVRLFRRLPHMIISKLDSKSYPVINEGHETARFLGSKMYVIEANTLLNALQLLHYLARDENVLKTKLPLRDLAFLLCKMLRFVVQAKPTVARRVTLFKYMIRSAKIYCRTAQR